MPIPREKLTDEYWSKVKPILLDCGIYDKLNLRLTIEGILYKLRAGCPWRVDDKLFSAFRVIAKDCDLEWIFIDVSIVSAHQHATGAAKK